MDVRAPVRWVLTGLLGLLAAGALYLGYRQYGRLHGPEDGAFAAPTMTVAAAVLAEEPAEILVHVAGAVQAPGLHRLPVGARVGEAVAAAGPGTEAAPEALNLAAPLADGDKVYVPARADLPAQGGPAAAIGASHAPVPAAAGSKAPPASGGGSKATAAPVGVLKVNINTADEAELGQVPGIGPYLAGKIVAHRKAVGRYRRVEDLLDVPGIGEATLARIRRHLVL